MATLTLCRGAAGVHPRERVAQRLARRSTVEPPRCAAAASRAADATLRRGARPHCTLVPPAAAAADARSSRAGCSFSARRDVAARASSAGGRPAAALARKREELKYDGVFTLLLLNVALFVADHLLHLPFVKMLYLNHAAWQWWQLATCTFCHASWEHLSSNIFMLYIFGKAVEEEEGAIGVWFAYLITGVGASAASLLLLPKTVGGVAGLGGAGLVSLGASGAVFGLFMISVFVKLRLSFRKLLEAFILGQFVLQKIVSEVGVASAARGGLGAGGVNHVAHLAGALAGVLLMVALSRLLPPDEPRGAGDSDLATL